MKISLLVLLTVALSLPVNADSVDEKHAENDLQLESFIDPLYVELLSRGLTPGIARKETARLVKGFQGCWASEYNRVDSVEQELQAVELGGKLILTYKSPCLDAFLLAIEESSPD